MRPPLSDAKATPAVAFCFFANHVLEGAPWARERLARFAGRTMEFRAPLLPTVRAAVTPQGRLEPGGAAADVTVTLPVLTVTGEPELAAMVRELARTLRWDLEEDLSRLVGDVVAHRVAHAGRELGRWPREAAERFGEALGAYAGDEARLLVREAELQAFAGALERFAQALDELEQRVARLA